MQGVFVDMDKEIGFFLLGKTKIQSDYLLIIRMQELCLRCSDLISIHQRPSPSMAPI
jgi:hypothetical protein